MQEIFQAIAGGDYLDAVEIVLRDLYAAGIIDGAVIFSGDDFSARIISDGQRITGQNLSNMQGLAKSFIEKALQEKKEIFEDHLVVQRGSDSSLFYRIQSIYICPIFEEQTIVGAIYIDRSRRQAAFSQAEKLWLRFVGMMVQLYFKALTNERLLRLLQEELWIGSSSASEKIRRELRRLAAYSPILLMGETGTGKSLAAEMLHRLSGRKGRFVVVSLPTLAETLFEAELFGCRKGAFTGAEERIGLIGEADKGTLFFDEISEIPLTLQAKLLRLVETGRYKRVGEEKEKIADCKIICASNKNLWQEVKQGTFRNDLYFRISAYSLTIPPLRDRREDIADIASHYLRKNDFAITEQALIKLKGGDFPGNVRELQNLLKKIMLEAQQPVIDAAVIDSFYAAPPKTDILSSIMEKIDQGENFWNAIKKPFLSKDLNREQVMELLAQARAKTAKGQYKELLAVLNLPPQEYHRFMAFLHKYRLCGKK